MALRNILMDTEATLRKTSKVVDRFDDRLGTLLDDMFQTMIHAEGVGLAAPQVGILKRVVVIDIGEGVIELINPEILSQSKEEIPGDEGCLSSPGEYGTVKRPARVKVKAQDRKGNWFELEAETFLARAVCHEIDHLNGVLFKDLAKDLHRPQQVVAKKVSRKAKR